MLRETHAHRTRGALSLLATTSGGRMAADGRALLEELVSVAAGIMLGAQGQGEHGPARAQTAHAQRAQAGTNARAWSGAPVKKEAKPHRRRASL